MVAPSTVSPPPLAWLRAFRASGRLGSFKLAARELHVTPSTISHQVRSLEAELGVALFARLTRRVVLTEHGEQYHLIVDQALTLLEGGTRALRAGPERDTLRIGMFPATASEIFAPRLRAVSQAFSGLCIETKSNAHLKALVDRGSGPTLDAVVRFGRGAFQGMQCVKLFDVWLFPVCAPELLRECGVRSPAALVHHTLVSLNISFKGWEFWGKSQGVELPAKAEVVYFDDHLTSMRAVAQGVGIGLGSLPWVRSWIDSGSLVPVFKETRRARFVAKVRLPEASYLVFPRESAHAARLTALGEWLAASLADTAPSHG